jgi:hypothetical protein
VLVENTARGPTLIDDLLRDHVPTKPVNPQGRKMDRLRQCAHLIRGRKVHILGRSTVEEAVEEIVAYPNGLFDDHLDAMTNFLLEAPHLDLQHRRPVPAARQIGIAVAYGSHPTQQFPETGAAMVRHQSVLQGVARHSFFDSVNHGDRAPGAIPAFDGKKMVRLKVK